MNLGNRRDQLAVRLHMIAYAEFDQSSKNRIGEKQEQEDYKVDCGDREEEHSLALLAVVKLTESGDDRQHGCHIRVFR